MLRLSRWLWQAPAGTVEAHAPPLAAVIHLCGAAAGSAYAKRNFRLADAQRCGAQDAQAYLAQVNAMKRVFRRLASAG